MDTIDWGRVAAPQADGSDIEATLSALGASRYAARLIKPVPDHAPHIWPTGRARWVTLADHSRPDPSFQDIAPDSPQVLAGLKCLDAWPAGKRMAQELLLALCPMTLGHPQQGHGCTCGQFSDDWGWIYVTADNPWGFAEGIVHETAHWKLRAFGIWFEDWTDTLLANRVDELYASPVRKDKPRPMGAVLHAQYSYVHVAAMCTALLKATPAPTQTDVDWTALQVSRITEGRATLNAHARGTEAGEAFLAGLDAWTQDVIAEGTAAVQASGLGRVKQ